MLDILAAFTQALLFAGILTCSGVVFAEATLRCSAELSRFSMRVMRRGALLTIVAALAGTMILVFRLSGRFDGVTLAAAFLSISGAALSLQLGGALLLLTSMGDDQFARMLRLVNASVVTLSFMFHGHASGGDSFEPALAFIHLSAAAWWVGSLWLLFYACSRERIEDLAPLVMRFSRLAVKLVGTLLMAGVMLAMLLISSGPTPLTSPYVQILALKIGLVAVTLGLALYNKFRLTPRLARHDTAAAVALRAMIRNELILIAVVLLVTALLTTYTTPFVEYNV